VSGYSGCQDVSLSSQGYALTGNLLGTLYKTNDMLYTYTLDYGTKGLVRFDVSSIPTNATVTSAKLDVTFESWVGPQSLTGRFLSTPWSYNASTLGWTSGGAGSNWSTPGIGSGDVTGPAFQFLSISASGYQRKSVPLDVASVQRWVSDATKNQGIVLTNDATGKVLRIFSSEASNSAQRPTLTISYN
jgi:hypothetical protein